jgi:hypothetical protein
MDRTHCCYQSNPANVAEYLLLLQPGETIRTQHQPVMSWSLIIPAFVAEHLQSPRNLDFAVPS